MSPEKLFHELLGLVSHWRVTELEYLTGKRGKVRIVIEDEDALFASLSCCKDGDSVQEAYEPADLEAKQVAYATEGKDSSNWDRFVRELHKHSATAAQIETVSIDMSPAYQKGARDNCPSGSIRGHR